MDRKLKEIWCSGLVFLFIYFLTLIFYFEYLLVFSSQRVATLNNSHLSTLSVWNYWILFLKSRLFCVLQNRGRLAEKRTIPLPPNRVPKKELASIFSSDDSEGSDRASGDHAHIKQEDELHYSIMRKRSVTSDL